MKTSGDRALRTGREDWGDTSQDLLSCSFLDWRIRRDLLFVTEVFIEVMVDLHEVLRNNSECSLFYSAQLSPGATFWQDCIVQYHTLDIDVDIIH